jgi:predicted transcriptional regulator
MPTKERARPTASELAILRVLWERGPSTVREVQECLRRGEHRGYTTVLKLLQIMHEKQLVERRRDGKAHVYRARLREAQAQRRLTADLIDGVFRGSAARLVMQALSSKTPSREDLEEVRRLLDELEEE